MPSGIALLSIAAYLNEILRSDLNAVFLVPPDYSPFATNTQRSPVVTWINFPHHGKAYLEWYQSISDITGGKVTLESTSSVTDSWEIGRMASRAYHELDSTAIALLRQKYTARYLISSASLPFTRAYQWGQFSVYDLRAATRDLRRED